MVRQPDSSRQTYEGYRYLLATLSQFAQSGGDLEWRERFQVVLSKSPIDDKSISAFADRMHELFSDSIYDEAEGGDFEAFNFSPDEKGAPHYPIVIPFDDRFVTWNPSENRSEIALNFYSTVYGNFLELISGVLESAD